MPKVLSVSKTSESYIRQGYSIIEPPLEFKGRFEMDINLALMNIAGISVSNVTKFITYNNLAKCSNIPGKTKLFNFFIINNSWIIIDLP